MPYLITDVLSNRNKRKGKIRSRCWEQWGMDKESKDELTNYFENDTKLRVI